MASEKLNVPEHVTIIMDGNGRWAKQRGQERLYGHKEGVESVRACTELAVEKGIKYLSVFAFSEENWDRPVEEIEGLMQLMLKAISMETPTFQKNGVRFRVIGDFSRLSQKLRDEIADCMKLTEHNTNLQLIIFLSYSGKWDILQAAKNMIQEAVADPEAMEKIMNMGVEGFDRYLVTDGIPDPDLIIRTSGENRLSNYLLWQGAYSEFLFVDTLWPDFRRDDFRQALETYAKRDRRYGKVK